jgi:hypothetical protein
MDGQLSFASLDFAGKKKRTKRDSKSPVAALSQAAARR